jgi:peptide/nickel transport system substrate-binding protein
LLSLAFIIACGTTATPTTVPQATTAAQPTAAPPAAGVPTATAEPATLTQAVGKPQGTLNIGFKELGPFRSHPRLTGTPQAVFSAITAYETPVVHDTKEGIIEGLLARKWSISADGVVWTFNLEEGVPFHKGYGEMTAEDFIWSIQNYGHQEAIHPRAGDMRRIWLNEEGWVKAVDDYTVQVHTGEVQIEIDVLNSLRSPYGGGIWIFSKKQSDELGIEESNRNGAGTGPWEIVEHRTGELWRFEAVEDHWRQTPNFAELIFWEIPEESTRLANFQVGKLDTFQMAFDSLPAVEKVPDVKFLRVESAGEEILTFYGNWYVGIGTPDQRPGYDPELPWVSSNLDTSSPEWDRARKVRLAMILAIDRELIIKELLKGEGQSTVQWAVTSGANFSDRLLDPDQKWDYDVERARQLLAEADYADGFEITFTPQVRGAPAEIEVGEAIATMWEEIGIRAKLQKVPYGTIRPSLIARTYQGATIHAVPSSYLEPMIFWLNTMNSAGRFNMGLEYPFLDEKLKELSTTQDGAERMRIHKEVVDWLFDNVQGISLYNYNVIWPLSAKIDAWPLRLGDNRYLSNFESVPHRK